MNFTKSLTFGFQHLLAMYTGAVLVPLIIGAAREVYFCKLAGIGDGHCLDVLYLLVAVFFAVARHKEQCNQK